MQQSQQPQLVIEQLKQKFEQQEKMLQVPTQLLETQNKEQTKQLEKLKVENSKLKQHMQLLHQQYQEKFEQLEVATQRSKEKDNELQLLNHHIQEKNQQIQQLQEKDHQMQQEINQLILGHNKELQTIKQEKERQLEEKDTQLAELRSSWVVKKKDIILHEREVGRGAYGWVKEATFQGCRVAVKCLHNTIISSYNLGLFNREMNMAARCRHPNLLQFIGATSKDDGAPFIVTELMHTSLRKLLECEKLSSDHIIPIMLDVALGLNYLHNHEPPILHRDVSSANVLLNPLPCKKWFAKLSDFGSVNFLQQSQTVNAGNAAYAAPEALDPMKGCHTPAMDIFSFGVLLHELCSRTQPEGGLTPEKLEHVDWKVPESQLVSLIISCINQEISGRPMMNTIVTQLKALSRS